MFGVLLESRAKRARHRGAAVASVAGHALFVAAAVVLTRTPAIARRPVERVVPLPTLEVPTPPTPTTGPLPGRSRSPSPVAAPMPVLAPLPVMVLPGIPTPDLTLPAPADIGWRSDGPARPIGTPSGTPTGTGDGIPFAPGVDKPALALSSNPAPHYPEILRRANARGEVIVQVVIDTTGRADMSTLRVTSSTHPLLTDAVRSALARARYLPAESAGRKVRMWAIQSFVFDLR